MAHRNRTRVEPKGGPSLGVDTRVAVPGPTGTKNTVVGGELTQLRRRVFAPRNKAKLPKILPLGCACWVVFSPSTRGLE